MHGYRGYKRVEPSVGGEHFRFARLQHFRIEVILTESRLVERYVHALGRGVALEPERVYVVYVAVVERVSAVVKRMTFHAEHVFHNIGQAVRHGVFGVRIVYIFVQRIIAENRLVFRNVGLFERVRVVEYDGGIALVKSVKIGVQLAQRRFYVRNLLVERRLALVRRVGLVAVRLLFHARKAVGVALRVVEEREPLEAFAQHRDDVEVLCYARPRRGHGELGIYELIHFVYVADFDARKEQPAHELAVKVADNALIGIRARLLLINLVVQIVGVVFVVGEIYGENVGCKHAREQRRGDDARQFFSVRLGHAGFEHVPEHAIQRDYDGRYEHVRKVDRYARHNHHRVRAQLNHGEIEHRAARALEDYDKQYIYAKVERERGYEQRVTALVPRQVQRYKRDDSYERKV